MKFPKYVLCLFVLLVFFLIVDQSGIGFKTHLETIKKWASGETRRLHFIPAWKDREI